MQYLCLDLPVFVYSRRSQPTSTRLAEFRCAPGGHWEVTWLKSTPCTGAPTHGKLTRAGRRTPDSFHLETPLLTWVWKELKVLNKHRCRDNGVCSHKGSCCTQMHPGLQEVNNWEAAGEVGPQRLSQSALSRSFVKVHCVRIKWPSADTRAFILTYVNVRSDLCILHTNRRCKYWSDRNIFTVNVF